MTENSLIITRVILLVDDDAQFLSLGQELLANFGFQTLAASHAEEALNIFRQQQRKIDLVILDFNLPRVDGYQLLQQLQSVAPQVKVIMASGFLGQEEMDKLRNAGVVGMIHKPFRASQLQTEIFKVLEE